MRLQLPQIPPTIHSLTGKLFYTIEANTATSYICLKTILFHWEGLQVSYFWSLLALIFTASLLTRQANVSYCILNTNFSSRDPLVQSCLPSF